MYRYLLLYVYLVVKIKEVVITFFCKEEFLVEQIKGKESCWKTLKYVNARGCVYGQMEWELGHLKIDYKGIVCLCVFD